MVYIFALNNKISVPTQIPRGANLNSYTTPGFYYNPNNNSSNAYVKELKENRDKAKLSESIDLKIQNQRFYQTNKVASETVPFKELIS